MSEKVATLTVGERLVFFKVQHHDPPLEHLSKRKNGAQVPRVIVATTTCTIFRDGEASIVARSYCAEEDFTRFTRRGGRERAFARAVRELPREERRALWHAWFAKVEPRRRLRERRPRRRRVTA